MIIWNIMPETISLPFLCVDIGAGIMLWDKEKEFPVLVETHLIDFDTCNVPNEPEEGTIIHVTGIMDTSREVIRADKIWVDDPIVIEVME